MAKRRPDDDPVIDLDEGDDTQDPAAGDEPAEEVITGPRIKIENGPFLAVGGGKERQLTIDGHNYEHVSEVVDQGEVVWVYRRM